MRELPILFSGPMVRAILDGRKTQTRRLITKRTTARIATRFDDIDVGDQRNQRHGNDVLIAYGADGYGHQLRARIEPGDTLWVRETWQPMWETDEPPSNGLELPEGWDVSYPATDGVQVFTNADDEISTACRPSIHMPRWASRITLRVTDVRVERLQDITTNDIVAEGIDVPDAHADRDTFARHKWRALWQSINAKRAPWASDPWVWVVEFEQEGE